MISVVEQVLLIYTLQGVMVSSNAYITASSNSTDSLTSYQSKMKRPSECSNDKRWFCFNATTIAYSCNQAAVSGQIICTEHGPTMVIGSCATYDKNTQVMSISKCFNQIGAAGYNMSTVFIQLPTILTELNDYMCGPLNRKGHLCSECADGFGPSVTSFGYRCANCTDVWYGVPLFLFFKLFPINVLYLVILVLQIRVTSPPIPCFIMYAQSITAIFTFYSTKWPLVTSIMFTQNENISMYVKVVDALYGVFHLEFFHFLLPPFCISSRLKSIHVASFGYISLFYPLLLIFLTWVCVELHGRNFRLLVWLWKPFHRCFVRLRRGWDTKSDIIDVFTTFIFLSYSTVMHQILQMFYSEGLVTIDASGMHSNSLVPHLDHSLTYSHVQYYLFVAPSLIIFLVFNILPPLLLILYPLKAFRSCLSKCHLNYITVNIFIEKIHGCYRNDLDGGRDMRSFSGLYFLLQLFACMIEVFAKATEYFQPFFLPGVLFSFTALIIALSKPYKIAYMTCLDTLIVFNLAVQCFILSLEEQKLPILQILILIPISILIIVLLQRKVVRKVFIQIRCKRERAELQITEPTDSSTVDKSSTIQPLIQPTSTILSYSTMQ